MTPLSSLSLTDRSEKEARRQAIAQRKPWIVATLKRAIYLVEIAETDTDIHIADMKVLDAANDIANLRLLMTKADLVEMDIEP